MQVFTDGYYPFNKACTHIIFDEKIKEFFCDHIQFGLKIFSNKENQNNDNYYVFMVPIIIPQIRKFISENLSSLKITMENILNDKDLLSLTQNEKDFLIYVISNIKMNYIPEIYELEFLFVEKIQNKIINYCFDALKDIIYQDVENLRNDISINIRDRIDIDKILRALKIVFREYIKKQIEEFWKIQHEIIIHFFIESNCVDLDEDYYNFIKILMEILN